MPAGGSGSERINCFKPESLGVGLFGLWVQVVPRKWLAGSVLAGLALDLSQNAMCQGQATRLFYLALMPLCVPTSERCLPLVSLDRHSAPQVYRALDSCHSITGKEILS